MKRISDVVTYLNQIFKIKVYGKRKVWTEVEINEEKEDHNTKKEVLHRDRNQERLKRREVDW